MQIADNHQQVSRGLNVSDPILAGGSVNQMSEEGFWSGFTGSIHQYVTLRAGDACAEGRGLDHQWGSLFDAIYHSDIIPQSEGLKTGSRYNKARGARVFSLSKDFLDAVFPLAAGSHREVQSYLVYFQNLMAILADGSCIGLKNPSQYVDKCGPKEEPSGIILQDQGVKVEIVLNRGSETGSRDFAGVSDILIESPQ